MKHSVPTQLNFVDPIEGIKPRVTYSGTNQGQSYNSPYVMRDVVVNNARAHADNFKLHEHGFEVAEHQLNNANFDDDDWIKSSLYPSIESVVKQVSGASHVFIFDNTIRRGLADSLRKPAQHVHVDYTHNTGPERAVQMIDASKFAQLKSKRFIQVNFWRSLGGPIEQMPLGFLDSQSLDENDLIPAEIAFKDTGHVGEIYALRHNPEQRWYYYPDMHDAEALLIKGYDTGTDAISKFTPHSAFTDPTSKPDAAPRQSIEVRTFAFFD